MHKNRTLKYIAGAFGVAAMALLSATATHTAPVESFQAKSGGGGGGGNPTGNATASTNAPMMQLGQTAGEAPTTTTTTPPAR